MAPCELHRSCISVFRQRTKQGHDFRIWNDQLIRYAGYEREKPDKTRHIIGDPSTLEFTKVYTSLKPKYCFMYIAFLFRYVCG